VLPAGSVPHPQWCDRQRCSVELGGEYFQGVHRSALIRSAFDQHTGNSVEVFLWSFEGRKPYCQIEFPGSLHEGIELTIPQVDNLIVLLQDLAADAMPITPSANDGRATTGRSEGAS
jgi:hypothetical protein